MRQLKTGGGNEATVDSVVGGKSGMYSWQLWRKEILVIQGNCWIKMRLFLYYNTVE